MMILFIAYVFKCVEHMSHIQNNGVSQMFIKRKICLKKNLDPFKGDDYFYAQEASVFPHLIPFINIWLILARSFNGPTAYIQNGTHLTCMAPWEAAPETFPRYATGYITAACTAGYILMHTDDNTCILYEHHNCSAHVCYWAPVTDWLW